MLITLTLLALYGEIQVINVIDDALSFDCLMLSITSLGLTKIRDNISLPNKSAIIKLQMIQIKCCILNGFPCETEFTNKKFSKLIIRVF